MIEADSTRPDGVDLFAGPQFDIAWLGVVLVVLALTVAALVVWFRTRWDRFWEGALMLIVIIVVPIVGPMLFLVARRRFQVGSRSN